MSWWWTGPIAVATFGAALLSTLSRRYLDESKQMSRVTERLRTTVVDLRNGRASLELDMNRYAAQGDPLPEAAEKGPASK